MVQTGDVTGYGSPVCDGGAPGALGGLGTMGITVEFGALYEDGYAPNRIGTLCKVLVAEDCNLCVTVNPTRCGKTVGDANAGVVMEDGTSVIPTFVNSGCEQVMIFDDCGWCFPCDHPDHDLWVAHGQPECWCYLRRCYGDADGLIDGGGKIDYHWVGDTDLQLLIDHWKEEPNEATPTDCGRTPEP